jgi:hypothetical protein
MTSSVACESVISPSVSFDLLLRSTPARVTRAWLAWVRRLSSDASTEPCARTRGGWGGGRACACGESDARRGRASGETIDHGCRVVTPANFSREPIITGQRLIAARPPAASAPGHALGAARAHSRTRARTSWPTARDPTSGRRRRVRPAPSLPRRTAEPTPARAAPRPRPARASPRVDRRKAPRCGVPSLAPRPDPPPFPPPPPPPHRHRRRRPHHLHGTTRPGVPHPPRVPAGASRDPPACRPHVPPRETRRDPIPPPLPHAPPPLFLFLPGRLQRPMRPLLDRHAGPELRRGHRAARLRGVPHAPGVRARRGERAMQRVRHGERGRRGRGTRVALPVRRVRDSAHVRRRRAVGDVRGV